MGMKGTSPGKAKEKRHTSKAVQSLERGVEIIRAFRAGYDLLGNSELAERTGLSRSTVSRLTQTLCLAGVLEHDRHRRAYRLGAPVLSFAHAMRSSHPVFKLATPLMRMVSEQHQINVGVATADRDEMVYLESIRYNVKSTLRSIVSGQRVPMELTSLGHAYLSATSDVERKSFFKRYELGQPGGEERKTEIERSMESVWEKGYCAVSWQPGIVALATPVVMDDHPVYVLNISLATKTSKDEVGEALSPVLLELKKVIVESMKQD
ncbi:IclR family transcriptional regulator [Halomonas sp. A29]|uniref:IclR family transcriptional regulator n=1 Tax=Halomonas sp. A29 TaxID=3102786 RepID=UPI00398B6295